jgi:large subunit ribosomal protein L29
MKAADLREKSAADLSELRASLARDVFQNRLKNFTNRLDDTSAMRKTRRDLARVLTLLRAQRNGAVVAPAAAVEAKPAAPTEAKPAPAKKTKAATAKKTEAKAPSGEAKAAGAPAKKKSTKKSEAKSS